MEVTTASPKGGLAPLDPVSVETTRDDASSVSFLKNQTSLWEATGKISDFLGHAAAEFDALFYPGGVGPMFDLATDAQSQALISEFVAAGKPVAAVCHGPVCFQDVVLPDGRYLIAGKEVTAVSNTEEEILGLDPYLPFALEDRLKERGATYVKAAEPWGVKVVVQDDGKFITGQNPASAKGVGEALVAALGL